MLQKCLYLVTSACCLDLLSRMEGQTTFMPGKFGQPAPTGHGLDPGLRSGSFRASRSILPFMRELELAEPSDFAVRKQPMSCTPLYRNLGLRLVESAVPPNQRLLRISGSSESAAPPNDDCIAVRDGEIRLALSTFAASDGSDLSSCSITSRLTSLDADKLNDRQSLLSCPHGGYCEQRRTKEQMSAPRINGSAANEFRRAFEYCSMARM
ncbi:uncharacterized protein UBRO_20931 [Ustilago bromivora]|uniref:Uncharacterized protein n=1 Tax=Ustilago bromivora TaxID=307758 RepID=A0A1K0GCM1_9BASI|nr:uncharacterized protein UBRO_20931 [Ustilago bromivora]